MHVRKVVGAWHMCQVHVSNHISTRHAHRLIMVFFVHRFADAYFTSEPPFFFLSSLSSFLTYIHDIGECGDDLYYGDPPYCDEAGLRNSSDEAYWKWILVGILALVIVVLLASYIRVRCLFDY
jgi:hypothetical protein